LVDEPKPPSYGTATVPADDSDAPRGPKSAPAAQVGISTPAAGVSVVTTVDEEEARDRQQSRPWLAVLGPLVALIITIAAIAGLSIRFMTPYTADQLYDKISAHTESDDSVAVRE